MSRPRKHHYVPQTYLAAFTDSGRKDGRLQVLDKSSGRSWCSKPEDAGCERDFYMLEVEGDGENDPLEVETFFGRLEGGYREAIAATMNAEAVPAQGQLRAKLMGFLAAQAMRVPGALEVWDRGIDKVLRTTAWHLAETPSQRAFVESEDVVFSLDQNTRLGTLLRALPNLAAALTMRHWVLVQAEAGAPDFVSSDRPLTVCWTEPTELKWPSPALGFSNTTVMFPVSKRVALLGMFEGAFPTRVANARLVGIVNLRTGMAATRFVYCAADAIHVTLPGGTSGDREDFMRHVRGSATP